MKFYCRTCRTMSDTLTCQTCSGGEVSAPADKMDQLVAAASIPNLATLMKIAKKNGTIQAVVEYGGDTATS